MTEAFYSPREEIAPVQKIAVVGANFSRPNNGRAIFSQTAMVNKSPRGECFTIAVCEKIAPGIYFMGRFFHATPVVTYY